MDADLHSSKLAATFETIIRLERLREEKEHGEAQFRVMWDKVRSGGPKRKVRDVIAKLVNTMPEGEGELRTAWEYEADALGRLDEIKERLVAGEFITKKEIADHFGVSKMQAGKYVEKGIRLGLWNEEQIGRWLSYGRMLRKRGKTEPPSRPVADWQSEPDEDEPEAPQSVEF